MNAPTAPLLEARGLHLAFGDRSVLTGIDLAVSRGEVIAILGKSGAGKSVLLKCLAGLLTPDAGTLQFAGIAFDQTHSGARAELRRRCSYLFQSNALFDSLTALANVALPLEQTTALDDREIERQASSALARFELGACATQFPSQLSGGQQKRLALARALVTHPELVLFDEPTAGLDPLRRNAVFELIARARLEFDFTAIVVTHDLPEALIACDRIALLDEGCIRFNGSPAEFAGASDALVSQFRDGADAMARQLAALRRGTSPFIVPALT